MNQNRTIAVPILTKKTRKVKGSEPNLSKDFIVAKCSGTKESPTVYVIDPIYPFSYPSGNRSKIKLHGALSVIDTGRSYERILRSLHLKSAIPITNALMNPFYCTVPLHHNRSIGL